jgi:pyridoxal phosphate enzyme (YggS family)
MSITENILSIREAMTDAAKSCNRDPETIKLIAVSKRHPLSSIKEAMKAGQFHFGENYIQEASQKIKAIPERATFHFIGHIQSNKAKQAAELFGMIETVDRFKLAKVLNNHCKKLDKKLDILIQVNIGNDPNKAGISPEKAEELLKQLIPLKQLRPLGLMTIPPLSEHTEITRKHFKNLRLLSTALGKQSLFASNEIELSMGMSHDFRIAIQEGATIIRVGTLIFGKRPDEKLINI